MFVVFSIHCISKSCNKKNSRPIGYCLIDVIFNQQCLAEILYFVNRKTVCLFCIFKIFWSIFYLQNTF